MWLCGGYSSPSPPPRPAGRAGGPGPPAPAPPPPPRGELGAGHAVKKPGCLEWGGDQKDSNTCTCWLGTSHQGDNILLGGTPDHPVGGGGTPPAYGPVKCLRSVRGHSVHIWFRQPCISKTVGRRVKRTKIWVSWLTILIVYNVVLTDNCSSSLWCHLVFPVFLIFKKFVSRKQLIVEWKKTKIWSSWLSTYTVYRVILTVKCPMSFLEDFVHFRYFNNLLSRKRVVVEWNGPKSWPQG